MEKIERACLSEVLTVGEVALMLSVSRKRVHDLCMNNKLTARQESKGRMWLISKTSVERRINGKLP